MSIKERIRNARIIEKIGKNKAFSERVGIHIVQPNGKGRERHEIHRC